MLSFFRQRGLSNVLYGAIILATILTFVIEFRPSAATRTASLNESCVARIRGRCIDPKTFAASYRMLLPTRSAQQSRKLNLKRVALDGLIERELLDDEAQRLGISVTDDEVTDQLFAGFVRVSVPAENPSVAQTILRETYQAYVRAGMVSQDVALAHLSARDMAIPVDFRDPKTKTFDIKTYERRVRNLSNRSTSEFREGQARELLAAKMRDVVREPIRVSESELWNDYERRQSTATVEWISVKESWATRWSPAASGANVQQWVKSNQSAFDTALRERSSQDTPKAGHFRHILVKVPEEATSDEKASALAKLSWAVERIKKGEPFAEVARTTSDDTTSAAQGGDLGDKTDDFVPAFKAAANALRPGESTHGAVETQFGYHFITKDDPSNAGVVETELKAVLPQELMAREKGIRVAQAVAKSIADGLRAGADSGKIREDAVAPYALPAKIELLKVLPSPEGESDAGSVDPPPTSTVGTASFDASTDPDSPRWATSSPFNKDGDPFPGLPPDATASVIQFAFSGKEGAVMSDPVRTSDGFAAVELKSQKTVTHDDFAKDSASLEEDLVRTKRDEALALYVQRLRRQAKDVIKVDESYVKEATSSAAASDEDEDEY
jgi:peptidyl-prolyl cis-trans isomerase D